MVYDSCVDLELVSYMYMYVLQLNVFAYVCDKDLIRWCLCVAPPMMVGVCSMQCAPRAAYCGWFIATGSETRYKGSGSTWCGWFAVLWQLIKYDIIADLEGVKGNGAGVLVFLFLLLLLRMNSFPLHLWNDVTLTLVTPNTTLRSIPNLMWWA